MLGHALCHALSFHSQTISHSITNNLSQSKQLIRSGNNTIRMNCGWTYCYNDRSTALYTTCPPAYMVPKDPSLSRVKAWSPYSCNSRRACLRRCFGEDFKAFKTSVASIFSEISILMIIPTIWSPSHIWIA